MNVNAGTRVVEKGMKMGAKSNVTEDQIMKAIVLLEEPARKALTRTVWKDGIDLDAPNHSAIKFAELLSAPLEAELADAKSDWKRLNRVFKGTSDKTIDQDITIEDLSMLIRMMVTKHRRGKLDEEYCQKAMDYLQRKGLQGEIIHIS